MGSIEVVVPAIMLFFVLNPAEKCACGVTSRMKWIFASKQE
jgi:hypothetical protein